MYKRHCFYYRLLHPIVVLFLRIKFGYQFKRADNLPDTYIVLSNHTTDYDPILVAASFKRYMYFVASEHITRWKLAYKFLNYCFAPIIRNKGTTATSTVMEMLRAVKEGKNICMFAEGDRSWDGVTAAISPATGKVIKSARCGLVTYRIEGGYFVSPRWSSSGKTRRGRLYGAPVNVYTPEQIKAMSVDEINAVIARDLYEDAYARQMEAPCRYKGKQLAESMENLLFICPQCGAMDSVYSQDDKVKCRQCTMEMRYTEYGMLEGVDFKTVRELSLWQQGEVEKAAAGLETYEAKSGTLSTIEKSVETMVGQGAIYLSSTELRCGDYVVPLENIVEMAIHGKHGIVFSTQHGYFEMKPAEEVSALKFYLLYTAYKKQMQNKRVG